MILKKILPAIAAVGVFAFSGAANAYPTFTVDPSAYAPGLSAFQADKITGNYAEVITLDPTTLTFQFSLKWNAGQFAANNGQDFVDSSISGLQSNYNLYALFQGSGTFTLSGSNVSSFTLSPGGTLAMYIDPKQSLTGFVAPSNGGAGYGRTNAGDDIEIATGAGVSGAASFSSNDHFNNGSFGQTTSFALTNPDGTSYFTVPNPFYSLSFESGQVNTGFTISGPLTSTFNGSLDVIFQNVPEPSSVALIGLALVGLGVASRRRAK